MDLTIPWQEFLQQTMRFIPRLIAALVIFGAGIFLSGWAARWAERAAKNRTSDPELLRLLSRLTRWAVLIVGLLLALEQVNFDLTAFVAGLGIIGFTVGFALQDIARNFVAGILLLIAKNDRAADILLGPAWGNRKDMACQEIVEEHLLPYFRKDNPSGGILASVRLLGQMAHEFNPPAP